MLGLLLGLTLLSRYLNPSQSSPNLQTPTSTSSSVLLAQQEARRKAANRQKRDLTGGLAAVQPTLGGAALWGMA
jgi:pectin methylesterase-like acyl-CoA thioesterase